MASGRNLNEVVTGDELDNGIVTGAAGKNQTIYNKNLIQLMTYTYNMSSYYKYFDTIKLNLKIIN